RFIQDSRCRPRKNQYASNRSGKLNAISLKNSAARKARAALRCAIGAGCSVFSTCRKSRNARIQKRAQPTSHKEEIQATASTWAGCTAQRRAPANAMPSSWSSSLPKRKSIHLDQVPAEQKQSTQL